MAAKYQHYTPRLHLKKFVGAQPKGMIWAYDKDQLRMAPSNILNTGGQKHFYSVRNSDGELDHRVDDLLTKVEDRAVAPYEKLLRRERLSAQERADFATFLATMYTRSPGMIRANAETKAKMMQAFLRMTMGSRQQFEAQMDRMEADGAVPPGSDRDNLWTFLNDKEAYTLQVPYQFGLTALGASDRIQELLFERHWHRVHAAEGYFITSDQAVTLWHPPRISPFGRGGFIAADAEVTFPLSPEVCLLITDRRLAAEDLAAGGDHVRNVNGYRAYEAERFVWSHVKDALLLDLLRDNQRSGSRISVSGESDMAAVEVVRRTSQRES